MIGRRGTVAVAAMTADSTGQPEHPVLAANVGTAGDRTLPVRLVGPVRLVDAPQSG